MKRSQESNADRDDITTPTVEWEDDDSFLVQTPDVTLCGHLRRIGEASVAFVDRFQARGYLPAEVRAVVRTTTAALRALGVEQVAAETLDDCTIGLWFLRHGGTRNGEAWTIDLARVTDRSTDALASWLAAGGALATRRRVTPEARRHA